MRVWLHPEGGRAGGASPPPGAVPPGTLGPCPDLESSDGGFVISTFLICPYSPRFPSHCWACGRRPVSSDSSVWRLPKPLPPASCSARPARPCRNCPRHHLRAWAKLPLTGENVGCFLKRPRVWSCTSALNTLEEAPRGQGAPSPAGAVLLALC